MIRKSVVLDPAIFLMPQDKKRCLCITTFIIVQCIFVYATSITILHCFWNPDKAPFDFYKLATIMYLYDKKACGFRVATASVKSRQNIQLSNDTRGLNVLPIKWQPAEVTVATRLSSKTRKYVKLSIGFHVVWMVMAIIVRVSISKSRNPHFLKFIMTLFFYSFIFMILFDLSMGIVYVAHIKQSLTKNMIVRYSGWSVILQLENADDFAGWLPMIASVCWLRGLVIFALNVYSCRIIQHVHNKIKKKEFRERLIREGNLPIPEARRESYMKDDVLYYRPGEYKPYIKRDNN